MISAYAHPRMAACCAAADTEPADTAPLIKGDPMANAGKLASHGTDPSPNLLRAPTAAPPPASVADMARAIARRRAQLCQAIAEAAYYRAEARGFAPGHELEDWLAAQEQIVGKRS